MMIDLPIRRGYEGPNRVSTCQFLRMRPLWLNYDGSEKLTDFQVKCILASSDIPFEKLRADKQDLLFVDNNNEPIPYWIEKADSTKIIVWLKFPEIIPGKEVFWLYYGNGNFSGASDGDAVFEFFDDFEDGVWSDKWENPQPSSDYWIEENGVLKTTYTGWSGLRSKKVIPSDVIVEAKLRSHEGQEGAMGAAGRYTDVDNFWGTQTHSYPDCYAVYAYIMVGGSADYVHGDVGRTTAGNWYIVKAEINGENLHSYTFDADRNLIDDATNTNTNTNTGDNAGLFHCTGTGEYDWILVRKYASPEPFVRV